MGVGIGVLTQPQLAVRFMTVKSNKEINRALGVGGFFILLMTAGAYVVGALSNVYFVNNPLFGDIALKAAGGNVDKIIPMYINAAMPVWFVYIFMLTLLSAAMSTSSAQFHAMGTAIGRDLFEKTLLQGRRTDLTVLATRVGIVIGVIITVILAYRMPPGIIAIATAMFFGLCASAFLAVYWGALFYKRMTRAGAIAGMISGFVITLLWFLFVHKKEAEAIGLCKALFGVPFLLGRPWTVVDPVAIAPLVSLMVAVGVSLFTCPPEKKHLDKCFRYISRGRA
jgi:SSS family solute:Na+ symporter